MAHFRARHASQIIEKLSKLWPVVGILGPRQCGKTTLIRKILGTPEPVSFDDLENQQEAARSPKSFLAKLGFPAVIDEVQKVPVIFDAIKFNVDKKRIPGSYFLTGSSGFSSKIGIRESLTGRIGIVELGPMTLAEMHQKPFRPFCPISNSARVSAKDPKSVRFKVDDFALSIQFGGMPIPCFLRDQDQRDFYWKSWLETTLFRDLSRFFTRGYDPDFAFGIIKKIGKILLEGELPSLKHFSQPARKLRIYLSAMQEIFLLRKIVCHEEGIGKEIWLFMDSGLAAYVMGTSLGEATTLSLTRHFLWNEWISQYEYYGKPSEKIYYKSAQGSPIDAIFEGVPFKIVPSTADVTQARGKIERPLLGAMKRLGSKYGYLVAPVDSITPPPEKGGIGVLPWSTWS